MIMNKLLIKFFMLFSTLNVYADGYVAQNFCSDIIKTLRLVSISVMIVRICVPIFIIVMGTMDIYNTVNSGKTDDLKKNLTTLGKRMIIGLIVFFIPTIVRLVVNGLGGNDSNYQVCVNCIDNPKNCQ